MQHAIEDALTDRVLSHFELRLHNPLAHGAGVADDAVDEHLLDATFVVRVQARRNNEHVIVGVDMINDVTLTGLTLAFVRRHVGQIPIDILEGLAAVQTCDIAKVDTLARCLGVPGTIAKAAVTLAHNDRRGFRQVLRHVAENLEMKPDVLTALYSLRKKPSAKVMAIISENSALHGAAGCDSLRRVAMCISMFSDDSSYIAREEQLRSSTKLLSRPVALRSILLIMKLPQCAVDVLVGIVALAGGDTSQGTSLLTSILKASCEFAKAADLNPESAVMPAVFTRAASNTTQELSSQRTS